MKYHSIIQIDLKYKFSIEYLDLENKIVISTKGVNSSKILKVQVHSYSSNEHLKYSSSNSKVIKARLDKSALSSVVYVEFHLIKESNYKLFLNSQFGHYKFSTIFQIQNSTLRINYILYPLSNLLNLLSLLA